MGSPLVVEQTMSPRSPMFLDAIRTDESIADMLDGLTLGSPRSPMSPARRTWRRTPLCRIDTAARGEELNQRNTALSCGGAERRLKERVQSRLLAQVMRYALSPLRGRNPRSLPGDEVKEAGRTQD